MHLSVGLAKRAHQCLHSTSSLLLHFLPFFFFFFFSQYPYRPFLDARRSWLRSVSPRRLGLSLGALDSADCILRA